MVDMLLRQSGMQPTQSNLSGYDYRLTVTRPISMVQNCHVQPQRFLNRNVVPRQLIDLKYHRLRKITQILCKTPRYIAQFYFKLLATTPNLGNGTGEWSGSDLLRHFITIDEGADIVCSLFLLLRHFLSLERIESDPNKAVSTELKEKDGGTKSNRRVR